MSAEDSTLAALVDQAAGLAERDRRAILGIAGAPGAGKSTLAAAIAAALGDGAVVVGLDGFHLDDTILDTLGRRGRKGAPDTFDAAGYVHLLRRLAERSEDIVYAPMFRRGQGLAVAAALAVPHAVPLVVTEGNYLLADGPFAPVRALLTEAWFLEVDPTVRRGRLVERHVGHGRSPEAAQRWVAGVDESNAALAAGTRDRADLVVRVRG